MNGDGIKIILNNAGGSEYGKRFFAEKLVHMLIVYKSSTDTHFSVEKAL